MSRFYVQTCLESNPSDEIHIGPTLVLASTVNDEQMILFPINENDRKMILHMLGTEEDVRVNDEHVGVFKTLVGSWSQGDRFLSGIFLDEHAGNVIAHLILSGMDGEVASISPASFHQAVILSAYQKIHIHMSERLIEAFEKNISKDSEELLTINEIGDKRPPIDQDVLSIAKQIMLGDKAKKISKAKKVKNTKQPKPPKQPKQPKQPKEKSQKKKTPKKT